MKWGRKEQVCQGRSVNPTDRIVRCIKKTAVDTKTGQYRAWVAYRHIHPFTT